MAVTPETISRFNNFLKQASALTETQEPRAQVSPSTRDNIRRSASDFESFIARAKPIVVKQVRDQLRLHREQLETVHRLVLPRSCDILHVAGLSGREDPYTYLIAWMLWPEDPDLALRIQKAWLNKIGLTEDSEKLNQPVEPMPQFVTSDCRPDIVIHFRELSFVLIVEAKTGTKEHISSDENYQTEVYARKVRGRLKLDPNYRAEVVFLTLDREPAENEDAWPATYQDFVAAVAASLDNSVNDSLRAAFSTVITHFLTHAMPGRIDKASALRALPGSFLSTFKTPSDEEILKHLDTLGSLLRSFETGNKK